MSSKRSRPYDDPPSPESSEEEEEEEEEQEEEEEEEEEQEEQTPIQNPKKTQTDDEEEEEEVEEEEEEEEEETADAKVSQPEPESESGSESEAETETNYIAKPIVKEYPSKVKNVAKTTSVVEEKLKKAAAKAVKPSPKQQSNGGGEDDEDGGEKKALFARVWSFEDELVVLQGIFDFKKANGKDPPSNSDEFYNLVMQKVSNGKFTKAQVVDKVRRLKRKYMTNVAKSNNGKAVEFSDPHQLKAYKLSGIIWGDNDGDTAANVKIKVGNSNAKSGSSVATIGVVALPASDNENVGSVVRGGGGGRSAKKPKISDVSHAMEVDGVKKEKVRKVEGERSGGEKGFAELFPHLMKSFEGECVPKVPVLDGLKSFLGMVDGSVLEEWDRKWKDVRVAEMNAYLTRIALIQEQANWLANAMKSSKS